MTLASGYELELLRSDAEFTLFRARKHGVPSVLALTVAEHRPSRSLERLTHEYELAAELDSAWAVRPIELTEYEGRPTLLLQDHGGEPLDCTRERKRGQPLELAAFLQLACKLTAALSEVHRSGLIHKDIKPAHILVGDAGDVRFTGFGIASRLRSERQTPGPPELIAGTLAYMAPEQTGRMNRSIDARSDLYALGVTFYELLTEALPFTASDPMELIHCHLARQPVCVSQRVSGLPSVVAAIVLKLLSKNPEDRYSTAAGLETDLRACLDQWRTHGCLDTFALGKHDVTDRLLIPEKLYGREEEIDVLLAAFDRVATTGASELVLVSGYAGIGKSSVVNELHKVLVPSRGLFATGKFDQYKRDIPYATVAQAFRGLVRQLLSKSDAELGRWRDELRAALGSNGQLMVNLIPELAIVIGDQPPVPQVDPQSAQARFHLVFRSLLGVFATPEHPLVLFIDDLQWLDSGTLELVARLATDAEVRNLLLVGAYRDNEVGPAHPLSSTLAQIRRAGGVVAETTLAALPVSQLAQLCADALHTQVSRTRKLAELLTEKAGGNPFFAIQFLTALADEGLLAFEPQSRSWQWDIGKIRAKAITANVAELMSAKLNRLPAETREVLGQLACMGNIADARTVALIRGESLEKLYARLRDAVDAGLVSYANGVLTFMHDRVHEAAYALIAADERAAEHLRIARALLSITPSAELEEKIFEIVTHFDRCASAIDSVEERELTAELYLRAGKRARSSSAYASAYSYFAGGRGLLREGVWQRRYRLVFELELCQAECEIVRGELQVAEERLSALSRQAADAADQAAVVCLTMLLCFTAGRYERAVEVGLAFLCRVGVTWSPHPTEAEVRREYVDMREKLSRQPLDTLIDMPAMTDPACVATMSVLTELFPAAYAFDRYLLELVLLRMTNLSLEHGNCESSSVAYSALNMALGSHFADYGTAYSLGQLACRLVERRGMDRYKARVYCCFAAFGMPWIQPVARCLPLLEEAFRGGRSMGDSGFAAYTSRVLLTHRLVSGAPLADVQRESEQVFAFVKELELGMTTERFVRQLELVRKLRGIPTEHTPCDDEWASQDVDGQPQLAMMVCYHWVFRLQERFFAGDLRGALVAAAHVDGRRWTLRSTLEEAEYDFYAALAHASASNTACLDVREAHIAALSSHYERIVASAENCPENFANRRALIAAEIARLHRRDLDAQPLYEEAIQLARKHGFVQNEGIASELAGEFYAARGLETSADAYLRNARQCFQRWGALSKVKQLDLRNPRLRMRSLPDFLTGRIDTPVAQLDVKTVDKASQTLSSEMVLPSLLEKLMRLAVEHAGAERGLLILLRGDDPHIEAEAKTGRGTVEVLVRRARVTSSDLPLSALHYVLRTRERVVLDDASAEGVEPGDEYVCRMRPRSVMCIPIFKQTQIVGALYLENNLTTCAFTADRVAVLDFLASQAAISLENARLYSELQRSEALLREAQHLSSTGSFYWRVAQDTLEFSEQTFRTYELDPSVPVTLDLIASRMHPDERPLLREMIEIARGPGTDLNYRYRAQMPDGSIKYLHLVAHGARDKEGRLEYIGAIQDVTLRHLAEAALGRTRSELAHVARVTTLGALTASIAHEVSQPLSGIVTNSSTCLRMLGADVPNVEGAKETVRRTLRDAMRASEVITQLRALFGNKGSTHEPVDLNEAALEVIALSRNELQMSRVVARTEFAADLPPVAGDRVQLQQVILNLLLNAADAMSGLDDHTRHVVIRTEREEADRVRLSVLDAGVGLDPQFVNRLFEAFYTTKPNGMGMGLSVSRSIIESHQGRLWAAPNEGPGATFSFSLPPASEDVGGARNLANVRSLPLTSSDAANVRNL